MPCNSDYMSPTDKEIRLQETARIYVYVLEALNLPVPEKARVAANTTYCSADYVAKLCRTIRGMTEAEMDRIVWDGKSAWARKTATWWEEHLEADRKRETEEQRVKKLAKDRKDVMDRILKTLTADEIKTLKGMLK